MTITFQAVAVPKPAMMMEPGPIHDEKDHLTVQAHCSGHQLRALWSAPPPSRPDYQHTRLANLAYLSHLGLLGWTPPLRPVVRPLPVAPPSARVFSAP
jgi:hypothetical protein